MYTIKVKTIDDNTLVFTNVEEYSFDGPLIKFIDSRNGQTKRFSTSSCEIEEKTNYGEGR